jgi:glucokinase
MSDVLIADIGATNSRFALIGADGRPDRIISFADDGVESAEAAIARYLQLIGKQPSAAVLAVAAPVDGDVIAMTNRDWRFRLSALAKRFHFSQVRALNDFEAAAWSLLRLAPADTRPLGSAKKPHPGTKVVFGPGTGLGVAALVHTEHGWCAVATEGGHTAFGAASNEEEPIFARLRAECRTVSAECVLSGPGLERLHRAVHGSTKKLTTEAIVKYAKEGEEAESATVALFARLLGRFAGDLALMFKAFGGVYIAGGVAQRLGAALDGQAFRAAFEAHPPYEKLLQPIPTTLITLEEPGLLGCAVLAESMLAGTKA